MLLSQGESSGIFAAQAPPKIDAHALRHYLERFINDNRHSNDVEHRWLAAYAGDLKMMAYNVKTGNHDTIKKQVNDFRLREIAAECEKLQESREELEKEEARLLREIEQVSQ